MTRNAGWYPIYDLRAEDLDSPIGLTYKAMVYQKTGNNWKDVVLQLSTGDPNKSSTPPNMNPWRLYSRQQQNQQQSYGYYQQQQQQYKSIQSVRFESEPYRNTNNALDIAIRDSVYTLSSSSITGTFTEYQTSTDLRYNSNQLNNRYDSFYSGSLALTSENTDQAQKDMVVSLEKSRKKTVKTKSRNTTADNTEMKETSVNTVFNIQTPYSIPADGKQYSVEIQNFEIPSSYQYYVAPRQETDVFLVAKTAEWDELNILPGNSSVYFQGTFVGDTYINPLVTQDTLELSLGRDKNIVVQRKILKDFTQKVIIGSKRKVNKGYEIILKNNRSTAINIMVVDQIPVSPNKNVEVSIDESSNAILEEDSGKLSWNLNLAPGEKKTLQYKFEVKYPKGYVINNL